ncbi:MAG: sensor histidine kinase [Nitrospiria bacterium]
MMTLYFRIIQPKIDHLFQRRKYNLQQVLDQLLKKLAVLGDVRDLSRQIVQTLVETFYAEGAVLLLLDEKTQSYLPFETAGKISPVTFPVHDDFIESMKKYRGIVESEAIQHHPAFIEVKKPAESFFARTGAVISIPLSTGYQFVGLIYLGPKRNLQEYTSLDIQLLEKLRIESAIALSNALLYDRVMRLNFEMTELNAQLEERVQARTTELETANQQLQESNLKIEGADRAKTQFLTNISHELRTPLNSVIGFSKILLKKIDGPLTEKQEEDLNAIYQSGIHLLGLISDLLDLSKIEAGKMDLFKEKIDLGEVVRGVMVTAQALVKGKEVELKTEVDSRLSLICGDALRVRQVVLNLVSNAIKFTELGEVTVRAERRGNYAVISVRDTGCGIRDEDQGRLFQEFLQVNAASHPKKEGTGLGLAISKKLVELHGGEIWIESRLEEGSTFSFTLPVDA